MGFSHGSLFRFLIPALVSVTCSLAAQSNLGMAATMQNFALPEYKKVERNFWASSTDGKRRTSEQSSILRNRFLTSSAETPTFSKSNLFSDSRSTLSAPIQKLFRTSGANTEPRRPSLQLPERNMIKIHRSCAATTRFSFSPPNWICREKDLTPMSTSVSSISAVM